VRLKNCGTLVHLVTALAAMTLKHKGRARRSVHDPYRAKLWRGNLV
jgi:hypothetical protein